MAVVETITTYKEELCDNQLKIRNMVMVGIKSAKDGRTKNIKEVFDRLEKKYADEK